MSDSIALMPPSFLATQAATSLNGNVTVFDQPAELMATGNKNCLVLQSLDLGAGAFAENQYQVISDIFEGDVFSITSPLMGAIELEAKNSPSLLEYETTATAGSAQGVADDLARALNDAVIFNRFYIADTFQAGAILRIRPKVTGFNATLVLINNAAGSIIATTTTLGAYKDRGQSLNNYGIYADVFLGTDISYGDPINKADMCKIGTIEKKYQPENKMEIDISGLLDNESVFNPLSTNYPNLTYKAIMPYVALYGESYSAGGTFRRKYLVGTTAVKWAIKAAQGLTVYNDADLVNYIVESGASDICFLTNQPAEKTISREAFEYISFLIKANPSDLVRIAVFTIIPTFRDGTVGSEIILTANNISNGGIYQADISPNKLSLNVIEAAEAKTIKSYSIQVRLATTLAQASAPLTAPTVTKPQVFKLAVRCYDDPIHLAFYNQWGCYDTIELHGEDKETTKRRAGSFVKSVPCRATVEDFIIGAKSIELLKTTTAFTGWLEEGDFNWLNDLAASPAIYWLKDGEQVASYVVGIRLQKDNNKEKYFAEIEISESAPYNTLEI